MDKQKIELAKFDIITNWSFNKINRNTADNLIVGDIVRIMAGSKNGWEKYYVEIIKIDKYKYGGINKPRKFYGKTIKVYDELWVSLDEGQEVKFRKENICEIPKWKSENRIIQHNKKEIEKYIKYQKKIRQNNDNNVLFYIYY